MFRFSMHDDGRCHLQTLQGKFCHLTIPKSLYTKLWVLKVEPAGSLHFQWAKKVASIHLRISRLGVAPCLQFNQWGQRPNQPLMYSTYSCDITFRTHYKGDMVCSTEVSKKWNRQECLGRIPTSRPVFSWNLWHLCKKTCFSTWKGSMAIASPVPFYHW